MPGNVAHCCPDRTRENYAGEVLVDKLVENFACGYEAITVVNKWFSAVVKRLSIASNGGHTVEVERLPHCSASCWLSLASIS